MSAQEQVPGRAGGDPAPWRWVVYDRDDLDDRTAVVAAGVQHTRLYASAAEVAAERIAELAYRAWRADRLDTVGSLVCRVKRDGADRWEGRADGSVWVGRSGAAHR
ncbi:hypothetical protein ACVCAH_11455 [Micromonospora sp. LZ34]